ncbi:MAG: TetR/AcrR family transcriptional regulator [Acidimicrobiia bacterium]|nr:TetR/AcrR family transcriptional regulator [Acidimicrobiia bacterium]
MGTREAQKRDQRATILTAAHGLFALRSFDEVTVAEVAEAAGVARATVFNHFGSKHGLVDAITEQVLVIYQEMLTEAVADDAATTGERLRRLASDMGAGIEVDRAFFRSVFRELSRSQSTRSEDAGRERATHAARTGLEQLFQRGIDRGELDGRHTAFTLALAFTSLANGVITEWLAIEDPVPLHTRLTDAIEVLLGPVEKR